MIGYFEIIVEQLGPHCHIVSSFFRVDAGKTLKNCDPSLISMALLG